MTWESVLEVKDLRESDYATYECTAQNELSSRRHRIVLERRRPPDQPSHLGVVNVTHDTATVSWRAGFDGGELQVRLRLSCNHIRP